MRHQQQFRSQAEYCLRLAELASSPAEKAQLITIACAWHKLAQKTEIQRLGARRLSTRPFRPPANRCNRGIEARQWRTGQANWYR